MGHHARCPKETSLHLPSLVPSRSTNWPLSTSLPKTGLPITQVCSYDHSGLGWSDDGPEDSCSLRVGEVHAALKNAGIKGPFVLVGHSLGGLVAHLYESQFPDEVAGLVLVDHAMPLSIVVAPPVGNTSAPSPPPATTHTTVLRGLDSDPVA